MAYRRLRRPQWWLKRNRGEIARDIDEEIAFHLEMRTEALMRMGRSRAAAAEEAEREFGDAGGLRRSLQQSDQVAERRRWLALWLDDLRQDVRFAARSCARAPGFTAVALCTLVVGVGAAVAMFTVVNAVVLRPLPYAHADRLVRVSPGENFNITLADELDAGAPSLRSATGISHWGLTLTGAGEAALLMTQVVEPEFFDVFSVRPALGRGFVEEERTAGRSDVVLLSHEVWRTRFGGDASVLGRRIDVDGYGYTSRVVIGVMPRGFVPPVTRERIDLWVPLAYTGGRTVSTDSSWYVNALVGRMQPDARVEDVATEVRATMARVRAAHSQISESSVQQAGAAGLLDSMVGDTRSTLWLLLGAVGLVLLLACANLANLVLARGDRRRQEMAARAALGGTRSRLVRELLTESALLAAAGCAGGILVARAALGALRVSQAADLPRAGELSMDARVVLFAVLVSAFSLVLFAVLPALRATAGDLRPDLGPGMRARGRTRGGRRAGAMLIAGEVALAMVLVTGAGLLLESFRTLRSVDPGMDVSDVYAMSLAPPPARYQGAAGVQLYDDVIEQLQALPGVRSAGAIHLVPFTLDNWSFPYLAQGHEPPANAPLPSANFRVITPTYFEALDIPLLTGRTFERTDHADGAAVGIINRALADLLWPGQDAIGREIRMFGSMPFRVVGVVGNVHQHALDAAPVPEMYRPLSQWHLSGLVVMIETSGDPAAVAEQARSLIWTRDRDIPVVRSRPLAEFVSDTLARRRFFAGVLTLFGAVALLLGAVGVYGVMTYSMSARVPEFGVRVALGATHGSVLRTALASGLVPVFAGLVLGTAAALASSRLLTGLLYGVMPQDAGTLAVAAAVLGGVAALASWLPARRVSRLDPVTVLNSV